MKKLLYLLIALLSISFIACSDDEDENPVVSNIYKISGTVKTPDGAGLAGAKVNLTGADIETTTSDVNGNYEFAGLDAGDYIVSGRKVLFLLSSIFSETYFH